MQIIVDVRCSPAEYVVANLDEVLSPLPRCPRCRKGKLHKHGVYLWDAVDTFTILLSSEAAEELANLLTFDRLQNRYGVPF